MGFGTLLRLAFETGSGQDKRVKLIDAIYVMRGESAPVPPIHKSPIDPRLQRCSRALASEIVSLDMWRTPRIIPDNSSYAWNMRLRNDI